MIPESELYPDIGMEPTQAGSVSSGDVCPWCQKPVLDEGWFIEERSGQPGRYWHPDCQRAKENVNELAISRGDEI